MWGGGTFEGFHIVQLQVATPTLPESHGSPCRVDGVLAPDKHVNIRVTFSYGRQPPSHVSSYGRQPRNTILAENITPIYLISGMNTSQVHFGVSKGCGLDRSKVVYGLLWSVTYLPSASSALLRVNFHSRFGRTETNQKSSSGLVQDQPNAAPWGAGG